MLGKMYSEDQPSYHIYFSKSNVSFPQLVTYIKNMRR